MSAFGAYSRYYDLLYRDKDYRGEAEFVARLIQQHAPGARRILELGSGTGIHGILLAEMGYDVTGIEISEAMLDDAAKRVAALPPATASRVRFLQGDARNFELGGQFDAIAALFHVMSYQTTNDDLRAVFANVKSRLAPGGVFIFDCWYGPAVLTDPPVVRVKQLEDEQTSVIRTATPTMHSERNTVDVNYRLIVRDKPSGVVEELSEVHRMRYLFRPELELLAEAAGLKVVSWGEWMSDRQPNISTWYVWFALTPITE